MRAEELILRFTDNSSENESAINADTEVGTMKQQYSVVIVLE
jgi:hypothetical protein